METQETQESGGREVRGGRPPRTVAYLGNLSMTDMETLSRIAVRKMRQTGEDVSRDRLISEAIQLYAKSQSAGE